MARVPASLTKKTHLDRGTAIAEPGGPSQRRAKNTQTSDLFFLQVLATVFSNAGAMSGV